MMTKYPAMEEERRNFDPQKLVTARKAKGISQRVLAARAGISQALVAELEKGKHPPSESSLAKITASLGLGQGDLLR